MNTGRPALFFAAFSVLLSCGSAETDPKQDTSEMTSEKESPSTMPQDSSTGTATFGAGCFWCVEAIFQQVKGVKTVKSGYSGGKTKNPTYKEVCSGSTGHAEVIQVTYDRSQVTFDELLEVFWKTHDPTTMNRQGNDVGTQYRSAVFFHDAEQKQKAEAYKKRLNEEKVYPNPIVTEIVAFTEFYPAEDYHQDYYNQNKNEGYCRYVIQPKLEKFEKVFKDRLKK